MNNDLNKIINDAESRYQNKSKIIVTSKDAIPTDYSTFPLDADRWLKIDNVLCVYIDMKGSTRISAEKHDQSTAAIYQYFTDTAVRILDHFNAAYIDVRGDGAFGLFNDDKFYAGICSAVSFLTFCHYKLSTVKINEKPITAHIGADRKIVLVKRIGIRKTEDKHLKQNEVWAGKPVNMASKLSSRGSENNFIISERVFDKIKADNCDPLLDTCECSDDGRRHPAWKREDLKGEEVFDFSRIYHLIPRCWCKLHGKDYMSSVLTYD